jgi:predicted site-specific integrase-resolvase
MEMILRKQMKRLVITHKDRLLRFGSELVFALCAHQQIEIVIIHKGEQPTFEEELAKDVLEIITVIGIKLGSAEIKRVLDGL